MNRRMTVWGGAVLASALVLSGCGGRGEEGAGTDPGITDTEVVIGTSYPLSGPASSFGSGAKGMQAYFDYVNDEFGGVEMGDGKTREVRFIAYDDEYDPAKTVTNVRRLVEQDKVFAVSNVLGTPTHTAVVDYLNEQGVPELFVGSVAEMWSADDTTYPWTVGWQPTSQIEANVYAQAIIAEHPDATVAVLYQNDDTGVPMLEALEEGLEGSDVEIVLAESFEVADATVDSQVAALANSNADVFVNMSTPKAAAQSIARANELGWQPVHYLTSVSTSIPTVLEPAGLEASTGIYSAEWLKVPGDPRWADDAGMNEYREIVDKYGNGLDTDDRLAVYGVAAAQTLVGALEGTEEPTREALMKSARSLELELPTLISGVKVSTSEEYLLPIRQMQLQQFDGTSWVAVGETVDGGAK